MVTAIGKFWTVKDISSAGNDEAIIAAAAGKQILLRSFMFTADGQSEVYFKTSDGRKLTCSWKFGSGGGGVDINDGANFDLLIRTGSGLHLYSSNPINISLMYHAQVV